MSLAKEMAPKEIIYWLTSNLTPIKVKTTVLNIQKQEGIRGKKATRDLDYFHKLLKKIARKFKTSHDLGMAGGNETPTSSERRRGKRERGRRRRTRDEDKGGSAEEDKGDKNRGKGKSGRDKKDRRKGKGGSDKDKPVPAHIKCLYCNGNHYVNKCPRLPKERREWSFAQHLPAKRAKEDSTPEDSSGPDKSSTGRPDNRNPGGRNTRNPKRAVSFAEPEEKTAEGSDKGTRG